MEQTRRPDGQPWSMPHLAAQLKARGQDVSRQYLGALITGQRGEPRISLVEAIADVFGVPVAYFTGDWLGRSFAEALPVLLAMRDPKVADLLRRTDLLHVAADPNVAALLRRPDLPQIAAALAGNENVAALLRRPDVDQLAAALAGPESVIQTLLRVLVQRADPAPDR
jgi:transcriptional regulator with XRE-family HTH domain